MERVYRLKTAEILGVCAVFTRDLNFGDAAEIVSVVASLLRQLEENTGAEEYDLDGVRAAYGLTDAGEQVIHDIFQGLVTIGLRKAYQNQELEP